MDIYSVVTDNNGPGSPAIGPVIHVGVVPAGGAGQGNIAAGTYNSTDRDLINIMFPVGGRVGAANPPGANGNPPVDGLPNNGNGLTTVYIENIFKDPNTGLWVSGSISNYLLLAGLANILQSYPDFRSTDPNAPHLYETIDLPDLDALSLTPPPFDQTATTVYSSVNGAIAGFPGIDISTAPPTFNPTNGLTDGPGYTGGTAVLTDHKVKVPEPPGSVLLLGFASLAVAGGRRWRPAGGNG